MSLSLAKRTLDRAQAGLQSGTGASLPELVRLIHTLSKNALEVSVPELVESIERDSSILAKVISLANKLGYNPTATPIASLDQAIHLIGFDRVRTLAMSLLLLEQSQRQQSSEEQREVAARALCAGLVAQQAALEMGTLDADQAFVCASLRNFGTIVMAMIMVEDYRKVLRFAVGRTLAEAERHIFGMTSLELARSLLKGTKMPETVMGCLVPFEPSACSPSQQSPATRMLGLTEFAQRFSELSFDGTVSSVEFEARSIRLVEQFKAYVPASETLIEDALSFADERLSQFIRGLQREGASTAVGQRLRQRLGGVDPAMSVNAHVRRPAEQLPPAVDIGVSAADSGSADGSVVDPTATWTDGIERLRAHATDRKRPLSEILGLALDIVTQGFGAQASALFAAELPGEPYRVTDQRGDLFRALRPGAIKGSDRTVFGICLSRRENVLIHDANDAKIRPYLPDWLQGRGAPPSFVLLPLFHERAVQGLIVCSWRERRKIIITPEHVALIRTLLGLVAQSFDQNRQAAA
ncbi:MAG: HDOD domain-containing protein [Opitutaceae bacterium]